MSIFITGNPRDIQIIKSGVTTYIPKKNAVVFTSGTEVGISYYGTGFSTTNEIIVLTYNAITSQTFSNSSAAATYLQDLIDSDQKYSNSIMSFSGISVIGSSNSYINLLSATTISGGTLYSGSTNLYNIFATPSFVQGLQTNVQPGLNTYTGGTSTSPSVNISALTINTLTVSGNSVLNTLTSNTLNINFLTGVTTRMVVVNSLGNLTAQTIPSASIWTYGTAAGSVKLNNGYTTANSDYTLVAGKQNTININSAYSVILGGIGNQIENNSQKSAIVGGMENYIRDYGTYSFIGAGRGGYIVNSNHSFIGSGYRGRIYNNSSTYESKYNSILNGYNNNLNRGINCTIIGSYNLIGNGDLLKYSLVHGKSSKVYSNYGVILGGYSLTLNDDRTTLVDNLQIATAPLTDNSYLLNINPSNRKVGRTTLSGGSGIQITTAGGNLTVTYTGATSSVNTTINNGINTFTAGTSTFQSVNITGASLNNLTVTGITSLVSASTTYLQVNTSSASTTNRERVIVYDSQPTSYSNVFVGVASAQTYAQLNIRNLHNGSQASSDIIATADNGSETSNYIDLGINSSTFAGYVGFANDGYLYSTGNDLWIGNVTSNKSIKFFTDGTGTTNVRVNISSGGTYVQKLSADTIYSGSTELSTIIFQQTLRLMALGI